MPYRRPSIVIPKIVLFRVTCCSPVVLNGKADISVHLFVLQFFAIYDSNFLQHVTNFDDNTFCFMIHCLPENVYFFTSKKFWRCSRTHLRNVSCAICSSLAACLELMIPVSQRFLHLKNFPVSVFAGVRIALHAASPRKFLPSGADEYSPAHFGPHRKEFEEQDPPQIYRSNLFPVCLVSRSGISRTTISTRFSFVIILH